MSFLTTKCFSLLHHFLIGVGLLTFSYSHANTLGRVIQYGAGATLVTTVIRNHFLGTFKVWKLVNSARDVPPLLKAYAQLQLQAAGVKNWQTIAIKQHPDFEGSRMAVFYNTLFIAPSIVQLFEKCVGDINNSDHKRFLGQIKSILFHESGHIKNVDSHGFAFVSVFATVTSFLLIESVAAWFDQSVFTTPFNKQDWKVMLMKSLICAFSSVILYNWYRQFAEYQADKNIPNNPKMLNDFTEFLEETHMLQMKSIQEKNKGKSWWFRVFTSLYYWPPFSLLFSTHPTCPARINKLQGTQSFL